MITRITMDQVASYKKSAFLETDKKVNLIYGLNGTGKSTLSDFLYNLNDSIFKNCKVEGLTNEEVLVYNQRFIRDYFYQPDNLKGIFTLSKENKEAEEKARAAEKKIEEYESELKTKTEEKTSLNNRLNEKKQNAENKTWEIKTNYAGGDRVLEYCLEGLKGQKDKLFSHIISIAKSEQKPVKTTNQLKKEVEAIQGGDAQKYDPLPKLNFSANDVETNDLFQKQIVGNENSTVAELIKQLGNSDWVKQGLGYLSENISLDGEKCPFCQEKTITSDVREKIKSFFDESYENDVKRISSLKSKYDSAIMVIDSKESYSANPFIVENKSDFDNLYSNVISVFEKNKNLITKKLNSPSKTIVLSESSKVINDFNDFIVEINKSISDHNNKIENKDTSLGNIKSEFWSIMRWDYDQTISAYNIEKSTIEIAITNIDSDIIEIERKIFEQKSIVNAEQKKTINIEEAIQNINNGLVELGIDSFKIEKYKDELYQIIRNESCDKIFHTLSEGEKMIISFLYFRELCKGKKSATSQSNKKIVIIDDPISSLSHIYIFNVGQMIKNDFFNSSNIDQVFLLTHSLYFYYEMTDANHDRRKKTQKLFRMMKNCNGTHVSEMEYEEIQNDYHSYWYIIKDDRQPPALIANCMRNIIEYFFNFIEKKDLNNVFQKPELRETKYQAFCRYINRESHSLGQNIFDYKEFNYDDFKEALKLVFKVCGYIEHYEKMIK